MIFAKLPSRTGCQVSVFSFWFSFSDFLFFGLIVSGSSSPPRVRASIMIFAKFLSSVSDFPFLVGNPEELSFGQFSLIVLSGQSLHHDLW